MQIRILSWLFLGVLAAVLPLRAQTPAAASVADAPMPPGLVLVAKVTGEVMMTVNGSAPVQLKVDDKIEQSAKINTGAKGSVVLVFSNGATTQIAHDSELVLEEFLQDPFASTVKVSDMTDEPSTSRTKLTLKRGELVGNVKKLNHTRGSKFIVDTPVGAAGIRGTTFKITFRPTGTGQAFSFQLSTVEGNVGFTQPGVGGNAGGGNAGGGGNNQGGGANTGNQNNGGTPTATATGTVTGVTGGVAVPQGQEITITVSVTTNAQGQQVITMPASTALPTTVAIPQAVVTQVTQAAQEIAVAVQQAVFTSSAPPPSSGSGGTGGSQSNSNTGTGAGSSGTGGSNQGSGSGSTGSTSGSTTGSTSGSTTGSTSGSTTGSTSGSTTGSTSGSTTGSTSGSTTGSTSGSTTGSTSGSTTGSTGGTGTTGGTKTSGTTTTGGTTTGGTTTSGTANATPTTVNISGQNFTGTAIITPPPAAIPTSQLNTKP